MHLTHRGWRFLCPAFITTDQSDSLAPSGTIAIKMPSEHSENRISRSMNSAVRSVLEIEVFAIDLALPGLSFSPSSALSRLRRKQIYGLLLQVCKYVRHHMDQI